jgi:hypothetical protein
MTEESDVSQLKTIEERCMLEGAVGYIAYLQDAIRESKFKTVEDLSKKIGEDGITASSALAEHFKERLKIAGLGSGLLVEMTKEKDKWKHDWTRVHRKDQARVSHHPPRPRAIEATQKGKRRLKGMLSETLTGKKPDFGVYFISPKLHKQIEEHAKEKNISVDQEAEELLELAIKFVDALVAAKNFMKGGDTELWP